MSDSARVPWLRIIVEGVVIVGSILLAFAIDAAWDGRQERDREVAYLQMLAADARETLDNNERFSSVAESRDWMGARLARAYYQAQAPPPDSIVRWFVESVGFTVVQATLGTVEALVSTGDLGLIHTDSLRAAVPRYLLSMETYEGFEEAAVDRWTEARSELDHHLDLELLLLQRLRTAERDSLAASDELTTFPSGPLRPVANPDVQALVRDPEVHRILARMAGAKREMRNWRDRMRRLSETFLAQLEAELSGLS